MTDVTATTASSADTEIASDANPDTPPRETGLFVAIRRFTVANGMTGEVKSALINRPRFVDGKSGFLRMDVISPVDNPDEVIIMTYWQDKAGYDAWYKSTNRRESEQFIPKGLKVVPGSTSLTFYEHVCS